ncbi:MAG: hypothetical protein NTZ51_00760 [Proteobacteria bacterium]|nr:hypothetical protein [Pseudomonadota bacterium]
MVRFHTSRLLVIGGLLFFMLTIVNAAVHTIPAVASEQSAQVKTIPVKEIKEEGGEEAGKISLEEVEKARAVTAERIYWLAGFWALIILAIILIRWQLRDDEKLYDEGYYSKEH